MLVAGDLKGELVGGGLLEVGGVVESNDASGLGAVTLALLVEEEKALAGLACPGGDGVGDLGLLATEVETKVLRGDGGIVEPELLLGESELPVRLLVDVGLRLTLIIRTSADRGPCSQAGPR